MSKRHPEPENVLPLRPLTPRYVEAQHKIYIDQLLTVLTQPDVRRIALAGQYGTGKSSILQGLQHSDAFQAMRLSSVTVSLATLDPTAPDKTGKDGKDTSPGADSQTNRIQREIVKQLLHTAPPWEVPLSRYRRLSQPRSWRLWMPVLLSALLAALITTAVLNLPVAANPWVKVTVVAVVTAGMVWLYQARLRGRFLFSEFKASAGAGSLTVADHSTWFDQYLDEIIYFFDSSGCRLVIFEDIDRFNDPHIFETLRDLNILLNSARQLTRRDKNDREVPIRFLYAARDSVFDPQDLAPRPNTTGDASDRTVTPAAPQIGAAASAAASRVKYFDHMISVVPFVTPASSRDHFQQLLDDANLPQEDMPGRDIMVRVSRHISDFRLITAIVNDYQLFNRLVRHESALTGLVADNLFALMVYKNTHPADFEQILAGNSKLNHLNDALQQAVTDALEMLATTGTTLRRRVGEAVPTLEQRTTLGRFLTMAIAMTTHANERALANTTAFDKQTPIDPAFWREAVEHGVHIDTTPYAGSTIITPAQLAQAVGLTGGGQAWSQQEQEHVTALRDTLTHARGHVLAATFAQAMTGTVLPLEVLETLARLDDPAPGVVDLRPAATELGLDDLVVDLLDGGYIDRYFSVYVSRYQATTLSISARNFMMLVVENPTADPDFTYQFQNPDTDVPAVLTEAGDGFTQDERAMNIQIFDHLLNTGKNRCLVDLAARSSQAAHDFRDAYLRDGKHPAHLVQAITARWPAAFQILLHLPDDEPRRKLINTALTFARPRTDYTTSPDITDYLQTHESDLAAITGCAPNDAPRLANILDTLQYRSTDLHQLPRPLADALVERHAYDINELNLTFLTTHHAPEAPALDGHDRVALDLIPPTQLAYLEEHLTDYVDLLSSDINLRSVHSDDDVPRILNDLVDTAAETLTGEQIDVLVARAGNNPITQSDLEPRLWPASARSCRTTATTAALIGFIQTYESGLDDWIDLLTDPLVVLDPNDTDDPGYLPDLAEALLALSQLPEARRIALATQIGAHLDAHQVPETSLPLIVALVEAGVVPDNADTLQHLAARNPQALPDLVATSTQLETYTPDLSPTAELLQALANADKNHELEQLLEHPDTLAALTTVNKAFIQQILDRFEKSTITLPGKILTTIITTAQEPALAARALAARAQDYNTTDLLDAISALPPPAAYLGTKTIDVPTDYSPLIDALKKQGLIKRSQKLPKRNVIRTHIT